MAALQGRNTSLGLFSRPGPRRSPGQCQRLQEHCLEASPSSFLRSPLLLQDEEVLFGVGHLPGSGAVGSWHCLRGSAGGVPAKGLLPWLQPSPARLRGRASGQGCGQNRNSAGFADTWCDGSGRGGAVSSSAWEFLV